MDTKIQHRPLEEPRRRSDALYPRDESLDDTQRTSKELREPREIRRPEEDDCRRDDRVMREERDPRQSSGSLFPRGRSPNNAQKKLEGPHQDQRSRDSGYGTSIPANSPRRGRTDLLSRKDAERAVAQKLKASGQTKVTRAHLDQLVDEYLEKQPTAKGDSGLTGRSREDRGSRDVRDGRTVREGIR